MSKITLKDFKNIDVIKEVNVCCDSLEVSDIYTSDLLSWVMGHVKTEGVCLLTVLNSVNLIAVATLLDLSAIVFCEDVIPSIDVINKAKEEGVNLYTSSDTTFHTAMKIKQYENIL